MFPIPRFTRIARQVSIIAAAVLCATAALGQGSPQARYAASLIEEASYRHFMEDRLYAHNGHNRGSGPEHDLCRDEITSLFKQYGFVTTWHAFPCSGQTDHNVVAELIGTTRPDEIYIAAGHFDSEGNPGADDNASAVATLLEVARLLGQWESEATIRLIAFDREEQGLVGSKAYVADHSHEDFRGMFNMDMIAYSGPDPDKARIRSRSASGPLKSAVADALVSYAGLTPIVEGPLDRSDHAPFEWAGFQAVWVAEYNFCGLNPHYHKQSDSVDTPGYIDYEYGANITRAAMGWLVDAAGVKPPHPIGDLNCDYSVDYDDIDPFVLALGGEAGYAAAYPDCEYLNADCNGDGAVDFDDIDPFVVLLGD